MSGSISMSVGTSSFSMLMDVLLQDNATGEVVWINNFSITASENLSSIDITISGRIYHPDHGYVDFVTIQPIRVNDADINASSAEMTITGANGSIARLTVIDNTQYRLEVDEDGDGTNEADTIEFWQ